jgi:hypothetical protein
MFNNLLGHQDYPYSNPFFQSVSYQYDLMCYQSRMDYFHTSQFFYTSGKNFAYPAALAVVYKLFFLCGPYTHLIFIVSLATAFCAGAVLFGRALVRTGIRSDTAYCFAAVVLITSYPLGVDFYVANMEGIVWVATALAVWAYVKDKSWLAAIFIGIAGAMKIYPLIYAGVFLPRRQYKQFALAILICLAINVASLAILGPSILIAYRGLAYGAQVFQNEYIYTLQTPESGMDHSLFAVLKICLLAIGHLALLRPLSNIYLAVGAAAGIALYLFKLRFLPPINLVLSLVIASILLPPVSHAYTLLHLYAPWAMLTLYVIRNGENIAHKTAAKWAMGCFGVLFTAQNYLIVNYHHEAFRFDGQVKAMALVALLFIAVRYPFEDCVIPSAT